jgi:hypothetical protein
MHQFCHTVIPTHSISCAACKPVDVVTMVESSRVFMLYKTCIEAVENLRILIKPRHISPRPLLFDCRIDPAMVRAPPVVHCTYRMRASKLTCPSARISRGTNQPRSCRDGNMYFIYRTFLPSSLRCKRQLSAGPTDACKRPVPTLLVLGYLGLCANLLN